MGKNESKLNIGNNIGLVELTQFITFLECIHFIKKHIKYNKTIHIK